jgi:hypothetical protein
MNRLTEAIWVDFPLFLRRISAGLAVATTDGLYLAAIPVVGLLAPILALAAGVWIGINHPGFNKVFTESLPLLSLVAAVGAASGACGFYLAIGFALGNLQNLPNIPSRYLWTSDLTFYGSFALIYLLFAFLSVGVPIAAKSLAADFILPDRVPRWIRALVALSALIGLNALLVFVWAMSAPLLIRPLYTAGGFYPDWEPYVPLQKNWPTIMLAAACAAAARAVIQVALASRQGFLSDRLTRFENRFRKSNRVKPLLVRIPIIIRLVARAAFFTALMTGIFSSIGQAMAAFGVLLAAQILTSALLLSGRGIYGRFILKIPRIVRIGALAVAMYFAGQYVLSNNIASGPESFTPFVILTVISAVLSIVLFPAAKIQSGRRAVIS